VILRSAITLACAAITCFACRLSPEPRQGEESGVVMELPYAVGRFIGEAGEISKIERETLPSDTEMARMDYHTPGIRSVDRHQLTLTIVLSGAERRSIHRPEVCLSGQGWKVLNAQDLTVPISKGGEITARDLLIEKPVTLSDGKRRNLRAHYVYWFVGSNVTTPSHWTRIWISARDSIVHNVNHRWAYPAVMALVTDNFSPQEIGQKHRSSEETLTLISSLIRDVTPRFQLNTDGGMGAVSQKTVR
jgi:hypothetical protein